MTRREQAGLYVAAVLVIYVWANCTHSLVQLVSAYRAGAL